MVHENLMVFTGNANPALAEGVAAGAIAKVVLKKLLGKKFSIIGGVT